MPMNDFMFYVWSYDSSKQKNSFYKLIRRFMWKFLIEHIEARVPLVNPFIIVPLRRMRVTQSEVSNQLFKQQEETWVVQVSGSKTEWFSL